VEYPAERGYRMEATPTPAWLSISIKHTGDSKQLFVHSRIHQNKIAKVGPSYSDDFSDTEIIKDLSAEITHRYY
jgi:hypothetical protein